ncbi:MAG: hypothetical protein GX682_02035 [Clostridiaceae bacterium]|nr:hypothetical protein [Clostridiaceae bacterium]
MKNVNGITLVSLVITIIILIILAGVSINLVVGQDGIITKAKQAKENIELAQIEEQTRLNDIYTSMNNETSGGILYEPIAELLNYRRKISQAITNRGITTSEMDSADKMAANISNISASSSFSPIEEVYKTSIKPINVNTTTPNIVTFKATKKGNLIIDINYDGGALAAKYYPISASATNCTVIQQDLPIYNTHYAGYLLAGTCEKDEDITVSIYAFNDAISANYTISAYIIENEEEKQIQNAYAETFTPVSNVTKTMSFTASKTGNLIIDINYDGGGIAAKYYPNKLKATHCTTIQNDLPIYSIYNSGYLMSGICSEGETITIELTAFNDAISASYTVNAYII